MGPCSRLARRRHEKGSVLIIIAGVLAALSLMAITFSTLARIEMRSAQNAHDKQMAIAAAKAGVGVAAEMLAQDEALCDDWRDPWYTPQYAPNDRISRPKPGSYGSHRCIVLAEGTLRAVAEVGSGINEDGPGDMNRDGAPGIANVDDDGDGKVDEDANGYERDDPQYNPNPNDDDEDGRVDEDGPGDANWDGSPGVHNVDDDRDGLIDECGFLNHDNDGDGKLEEDPPGDHVDGLGGTLWSEDRFDEGQSSSIYTEDYPGLSFQRNYGYCARLRDFVAPSRTGGAKPDDDNDGLVNERMWYTSFTYNNWWWSGSRQVYPFMDGDEAEGQRHVDENADGCADGWSWNDTNPYVYYWNGGTFYRADEDRTGRTGWDINPFGAEPEGVGRAGRYPGYNRFRSYAGGIYGMNAEDDDEDSDLVGVDENEKRGYWWKVGRPTGFIRDEGGKINLNVHGSLYDPALFFDPDTLKALSRKRDGTGAPNRYTGYCQSDRGRINGATPFHDVVDPVSGGLIGNWQNRNTITRKDVYGWARDGRIYDQGFDVSLVRFFRAYGFSVRQAQNFALAVVRYRYGPDGRPGVAGLDDDLDWERPRSPTVNNPALPGECQLDGRDNDGDHRPWRMGWIGSSSDRRSAAFQDQGISPAFLCGLFARDSNIQLFRNHTWWAGRYDNCPTFFRLTGSGRPDPYAVSPRPALDGFEETGIWPGGTVTGLNAHVVRAEGREVFPCSTGGRWIGASMRNQPPFKCPFDGTVQNAGSTTVHQAVDEDTEGIDEDDEFDPLHPGLSNPSGRYATWRALNGNFTTEPQTNDDRAFATIDEFVDALLEKRDPRTGVASATGESAVSYAQNDRVDNDYDGVGDEGDGSEEYAEATRIFNIVREDLSVEVANCDTGLIDINVDRWGFDDMDNDGDGEIDEVDEDMTGWRATAANRRQFSPVTGTWTAPVKVEALANAYRACGVKTPASMSPPSRTGVHWGVLSNIVDFQDEDPFPTGLYTSDQRQAARPYHFGAEGVHLSEVMFGAERAGDTDNYATTQITLSNSDVNGDCGGDNAAMDGWKAIAGQPGMFRLEGDYDAGGVWDPPGAGTDKWITGRFSLAGMPIGYYVAVIYGDVQVNGPTKYPLEVYVSGNNKFSFPPAFWQGAQSGLWNGNFRKVTIFGTGDVGTDEHGYADGFSPMVTTFTSGAGVPTQMAAVRIFNPVGTNVEVRAKQPLLETDPKPVFGIRLVNWYMEFVNISRKPVKLINRGVNDQNVSELLYLDAGPQGASNFNTLFEFPLSTNDNTTRIPRQVATWCPPGLEGNERGAGEPAGKTCYIPAAHADGQFPPNYGHFVIALCEDAYDKTWGDGSGTWGDDPLENYPVYFKECTAALSRQNTTARRNPVIFMFGRTLFTQYNPNTDDSAGGIWPTNLSNRPGIRLYATTTPNQANQNGKKWDLLAGSWIDMFEGKVGGIYAGGDPLDNSANRLAIAHDLTELGRRTGGQYSNPPEYASLEKIAPYIPIWRGYFRPWLQGAVPQEVRDSVYIAKFYESEPGLEDRSVWRPIDVSGMANLRDRGSQAFNDPKLATMNCMNTRYKYMNPKGIGTRRQSQDMNVEFIKDERVAPMVFDGPFPSVGWLGFVPSYEWGATLYRDYPQFLPHPWRNLTPRPHRVHFFNPSINPLYTLLGLRVGRTSMGARIGWGSYPYSGNAPISAGNWRPLACVPGVRAKININTASTPVLQAAFPSAVAAKIVKYRPYRCAEDIMGFPAPSAAGMLNFGEIPDAAAPNDLKRTTFMRNNSISGCSATVWTGYVDPTNAGNYVTERETRPKPFFARYAFETYSMDADLVLTYRPVASQPYRDRNEDHDDSGAGLMLDDVACDSTEQLEWFMRYCNVIDIKSRFFTVYSRGRVFSPSGLAADARVRAIVGRSDDTNEGSFLPLSVGWYNSAPFRGPNGRPEGITIKNIESLDN